MPWREPLRQTNAHLDELDAREATHTIKTRVDAHNARRGYITIAACLLFAGLGLFARLEQSSCLRSNEVRRPANVTSAVWRHISVEYAREASEPRRTPQEQRDFRSRSANLHKAAVGSSIVMLHCSLPFPQR